MFEDDRLGLNLPKSLRSTIDNVKASPVPELKLERAGYKQMFYGKVRIGQMVEGIE